MAGHIEFFRAVSYWDAFELSYQLYGERFAGRGFATEAVQLLVDYLFATKPRYRIQLVIVPENTGSSASPRSAGSPSKERSAERSSTTAGTTTCSCTPFCGTDQRPWHTADRG